MTTFETTTPTAYCAAGCLRIVQQPGDLCMQCLAHALGGYPMPEPEEPDGSL